MTNTDVRGRAYFSKVSEHGADGCGRFGTGLNSLVGAPGRNRTAATNPLNWSFPRIRPKMPKGGLVKHRLSANVGIGDCESGIEPTEILPIMIWL